MSAITPEWITLPDLTEYNFALDLMQERLHDVIDNRKGEAIFLVEHPDTYTAGTSYKDDELIDHGDIPVIYTGRGGKFTYHGPGQRVIYPILNLASGNRSKDLRLYVSLLEQLIINTLKEIGVHAYTIKGKVGIWVDIDIENNIDHNIELTNISPLQLNQNISFLSKNGKIPAKIGAIGVRVKKWVTYHGAAINIDPDLGKYKGIIPCGINDFPVTSLANIGINITMSDFDYLLKKEFSKLFCPVEV